ncbi:hypothetical protein Tco_0397911 [Tanacetum coccineum]
MHSVAPKGVRRVRIMLLEVLDACDWEDFTLRCSESKMGGKWGRGTVILTLTLNIFRPRNIPRPFKAATSVRVSEDAQTLTVSDYYKAWPYFEGSNIG